MKQRKIYQSLGQVFILQQRNLNITVTDEEWQNIWVSACKIVVCSAYSKDVLNFISSFLFLLSMNLSLKCFSRPKCFSKLDRHTIACETKLASKTGCLVFTLPAPPRPAGQLPVSSRVQGGISFLTDFPPSSQPHYLETFELSRNICNQSDGV